VSRLRISTDADDDLAHLYRQGVGLFGVLQADRYIDELLAALDLISTFPRMARLRHDIDPPVWAYPFKAHVILYDIDDHGDVLVVRIRHAHEDWQETSAGADAP
tara:strand:+ start:830 stop:1141 length:312 start_codon:yes stop_codon:yes gene_type:complete